MSIFRRCIFLYFEGQNYVNFSMDFGPELHVPHSFLPRFLANEFSTMTQNAYTLRHCHQAEVFLLGGAFVPLARFSARNFRTFDPSGHRVL